VKKNQTSHETTWILDRNFQTYSEKLLAMELMEFKVQGSFPMGSF
jgi:hypothetical protein